MLIIEWCKFKENFDAIEQQINKQKIGHCLAVAELVVKLIDNSRKSNSYKVRFNVESSSLLYFHKKQQVWWSKKEGWKVA